MHNHRQGNDGVWADGLNEIRTAGLSEEVVDMLFGRITDELLCNHEIIHGFYKNADVNTHNEKMLNSTEGEEDKTGEEPVVKEKKKEKRKKSIYDYEVKKVK